MNVIIGVFLQGAGAFILAASAQSPAAVVEEIQGSVPGIAFMDYVDPGQRAPSKHFQGFALSKHCISRL